MRTLVPGWRWIIVAACGDPGSLFDNGFALSGHNFLGATVQFCVLDQTVPVGEPGTTLAATISLFSLKTKFMSPIVSMIYRFTSAKYLVLICHLSLQMDPLSLWILSQLHTRHIDIRHIVTTVQINIWQEELWNTNSILHSFYGNWVNF